MLNITYLNINKIQYIIEKNFNCKDNTKNRMLLGYSKTEWKPIIHLTRYNNIPLWFCLQVDMETNVRISLEISHFQKSFPETTVVDLERYAIARRHGKDAEMEFRQYYLGSVY